MRIHSSSQAPPIVALTGGIGSGKSTCARAFADLGAPCIDADLVARSIHQDRAHPAMAEVAKRFPGAMSADGRLARGSLRTVFADPVANDALKRVLGPWVLAGIARWAARQNAPYVVCESALAARADVGAARVLAIDTPLALRLARIAQRNPDWSRAQVEAIVALQPAREAYLADADDIVVNDGAPGALAQRVRALHLDYLTLWTTP